MDLSQDRAIISGCSMVSIGTHKLFISVTGPSRTPLDPIVVVLAGAGDVASSYVVVERLVCSFARILLYDRSGLGRSEGGPNQYTASIAASELHMLLTQAQISPPLLLVGHSYGAIVAREYLHLYPDNVAGMVLFEAATERQSDFFRIPDPDISGVMGNLNYAQVTGLKTDSKLSREEWRTRVADISRGAAAWQAEASSFVEVCKALRGKEQYKRKALGAKPLSVIRANSSRDYQRIYEKGIEAGNGTEEQREAFRQMLNKWEDVDREMKEEQLLLSFNSRLVHIPDCGHHVHLVRPDILVQEIRWVKDQISGEPEGSIEKL
ncbi:hypothetical protein LOZ12_006417 [Ophidiomyces ophidiicola]|uniref:Uncharacterized protein n=1 Tax=Ophidiomyces ophidiicola TaxID=1387563 RepID=A0ACB8UPI8_9EURO|nr:hypothetical protein LOZ64_006504 [Ophidiomyces ophidiicola]KAI1935841.1 hypothetical protein LOZ62_005843 [Ophidiomyces ophidiicola]KAI1963832.1 hypothetical protein LOZ56_006321 [Ophidiomyces ophidiicola]KAI2007983.1 hypothetical protein LOZ50_002216 [Ophidiomyces ophidiicola]KAI2008120.1 hypothetical protein LOZ46_006691 [Ophidiomyces ophidiicola]